MFYMLHSLDGEIEPPKNRLNLAIPEGEIPSDDGIPTIYEMYLFISRFRLTDIPLFTHFQVIRR